MTALYTTSIFLSAFLLFSIQPLAARHLLPILGGAPAVWNTAMLFFQGMLLLGYLYAHLANRLLGTRRQALVHLLLMIASLVWLPIAIARTAALGAVDQPVPWLLARLASTIGLPFFLLAANASSLQRWLSQTRHPDAENPYFLYAASNIGSLVALVGYPILVETTLRLGSQTRAWSGLYVALVALLAVCAALMLRSYDVERGSEHEVGEAEPGPHWQRRARWVLLAFVPSSLLLGTTTIITVDIAAVPLVWTLPLAIYLLSFVLVFARKPRLIGYSGQLFYPLVLVLALASQNTRVAESTAFLLVHLAVLFLASMACHARLAGDRPSTRHLTEFYLWLSVGGVMGGVFNVLLAPVLFDRTWEFPLVLALACLVGRSAEDKPEAGSWRDLALPVGLGGLLLVTFFGVSAAADRIGGWVRSTDHALEWLDLTSADLAWGLFFLVPGAAALLWLRRPARFSLVVLGLFSVATARPFDTHHEVVHNERSFFGQLLVFDTDQGLRYLKHGTTTHGIQWLDPQKRLEPTAYFHREGPLGELFSVLPGRFDDDWIGVVGLGTGTIACLAGSRQQVIFFEIDPAVDYVARESGWFSFLHSCPARSEVVIGDARQTLSVQPDHRFGILIVDAFNSDSVPVHLLTREALALYLQKLDRRGILAFHTSSRHLDLKPVLAALARDAGLAVVHKYDGQAVDAEAKYPSEWVMMSADRSNLRRITAKHTGWKTASPDADGSLWTDDFSNVISVLR